MTTLGYWTGCAYELAARCRPRMGWRSFQRWTRLLTHLRDVSVCLAAVVLWAAALYLAAA